MKISFLSVILIIAAIFSTIPLILTLNMPDKAPGIVFQRPPIPNALFRRFAYIAGAVSEPGVYEVTETTRVFELVRMAGGVTKDANREDLAKRLNLSALVKDEEHIVVPVLELELQPDTTNAGSHGGLINLNNASSSELQELPGVGESTAAKIIAARPFKSIEGLLDVSGIGDKTFSELKHLVSI